MGLWPLVDISYQTCCHSISFQKYLRFQATVDFVNFGIVPVFIIYLWINEYTHLVGFDWALVLFFAICMTVRLARFNVDMEKEVENPILEKYFFHFSLHVLAIHILSLHNLTLHHNIYVAPFIYVKKGPVLPTTIKNMH